MKANYTSNLAYLVNTTKEAEDTLGFSFNTTSKNSFALVDQTADKQQYRKSMYKNT